MLKQDAAFDAELKSLETEAVFIEDLLIVLPSTHPQIKSAADLRVGSLAALEPGCTYRRIAEHWARSVERPADQRTWFIFTLSWQALRRETRQVSCPDQFLT